MQIACPLPPQQFMDAVAGQSVTADVHLLNGKHIHDLVVERCRFTPTDVVLDIGAGCGRAASQFLGEIEREYHGIDIVLPMVEWCRENISTIDGRFKFHHADLANTLYSKQGMDAANYRFPFADATFDVVFATSVFTHLVPASAIQYASEISRVLKPRGRTLLTFYFDDDKSAHFPHKCDGFRAGDKDNVEACLGYEEAIVWRMLWKSGLQVVEISRGTWTGCAQGWTYQDAVLAKKRA